MNMPFCPHCNAPLTGRPLQSARVGLTARMRAAQEAIGEFTARMGYCPSYDQIALMLNLQSRSGVNRLVKSLEERGWLTHRPNRERSIVLTQQERDNVC